jgi:hypothetical protein
VRLIVGDLVSLSGTDPDPVPESNRIPGNPTQSDPSSCRRPRRGETALRCGIRGFRTSCAQPLAMQKVEGSNPFSRFSCSARVSPARESQSTPSYRLNFWCSSAHIAPDMWVLAAISDSLRCRGGVTVGALRNSISAPGALIPGAGPEERRLTRYRQSGRRDGVTTAGDLVIGCRTGENSARGGAR